MAAPAWKPWHQVVTVRDDLRKGELSLNLFAADLYEVVMQSGKREVYEKPEEFFALTFPTYNLRQLVRDVVLRLAGKNDKAVRQLELTYGGGKTHTLITLYHLVNQPDQLPNLPAVEEFTQEIGQKPPQCRIASLCFDKLDVEKGMEIRDPQGNIRLVKYPWSVLAWQIAGADGLKLLHPEDKAEERETAPAENLLTQLLEIPMKENLGVLVLIDEVLMYVREKVSQDRNWRSRMVNFFQYLTQAATKVDRCCIVASLLASDTKTTDSLGRELQSDLYDIFQRQREEAVEPVVKEDVAELLRRRFFTPESIKNKDAFRPHVVNALKGIKALDEQTDRQGPEAEERYLKSYPFHPDLTEVFYSNWTQLQGFQRARGVLRTFALAIREAEAWDMSPIIGPAVFLTNPKKSGLSDAVTELVTVADTEEWEGKRQAWTGILDREFGQARAIQQESVGLKYREVEQAVISTFLHSQPTGRTAKTRELFVLVGSTRPDRIELEKGLNRWVQTSHWLDDLYTAVVDGQLPTTWRLGNKPNLQQMHSGAINKVSDEMVMDRLLTEISKIKQLSANAAATGVKVHVLPQRPKDVEDEGLFHYVVLGPNAASESGKPSTLARKYIDEKSGPDAPRVYRNSILLLTPSKDGLELAKLRVRDYLAWEFVAEDVKKQASDGNVDPARAQTLRINIDTAKGKISESIRQAYCVVVTVSEKNDIQAFKLTIEDEAHFNLIKRDQRSRIQDTAVTAEALLPDGPYNLWKEGEKSRYVKDLAGAFAQHPHLPKMLKSSAIMDTLVDGCEQGSFVLRLRRPDGTYRTWWMSRPDDTAMHDPAMELVLPESAELAELSSDLLKPGVLPGLWHGDEIHVNDAYEYFSGGKVVQVDRGGYQEPIHIPKADKGVVASCVESAVASGKVWLLSGPASLLAEEVPAGVLQDTSLLLQPPSAIPAGELLPANLSDAWSDETANGAAIASALSIKFGRTLPWKTIKDLITAAINARFVELTADSGTWPCDYSAAKHLKIKEAVQSGGGSSGSSGSAQPNVRRIEADLEPSQIQDLGDAMPELLELKAKSGLEMRFHVSVEVDGGDQPPDIEAMDRVRKLFNDIDIDIS